ncbi:MAG TPA: cell division protein FtsA [Stellaceae bacterium]|nr:cell division protein FtsA [Stellaceae bacterium]
MMHGLPRRSLVGVVDIGTSKVCCFIARPEEHGPKIVGIGHQLSRGVRNGVIVDLEQASQSVITAIHAAEEMAGELLQSVVVNLSGGFHASRIVQSEINLNGREVGDADLKRVLNLGHHLKEAPGREVIHAIPVGFSIDGSRGIRDPRGMSGVKLAVNMHAVAADSAVLRNIATCLGRCHLDVEAFVASPYAAGLSALVEDDTRIGVTLVDMGGGTTTVSVFYDGNLVFADSIPIGGNHVTNDIVRGLSTPLLEAERMKTLQGCCITSSTDEREMIAVPQIGDDEDTPSNRVPKSYLVGIIAPRLEETFDMVRDRLDRSGFDKLSGRRVVLTGGACQLAGVRELAALILDKQVSVGVPRGIAGLAPATAGPAFATSAGLVHFAFSEKAETPRSLGNPVGLPDWRVFGLWRWLRENI